MLEIGGKFGDYTVERLLGRGGMGEVYLIRDPLSGADYALKIMTPPKGEDEHEWRKRFAREADFAMKVRHRNLIAVHDVGEDPDSGRCWLIMDYMPGGSVAGRLKDKGRFKVGDAIAIVVQIASALERAHAAGVVHRDLKPENILFDAEGVPHLADLGIAKFSGDAGQTTTFTATGVIIGSPAYMAPEQMLDSRQVDGRADIYSLGVVFWEMLAGKRPHGDQSVVELMAKALRGEEVQPVRQVRPDVPEAVSRLVSVMCATDRENRPPSAVEVIKLCRQAASGMRVKVRPRRRRPSRQLARGAKVALFLLKAAAALLVFAGGGWLCGYLQGRQLRPQPASSVPATVVRQVAVTNYVEEVHVVTNFVDLADLEADVRQD